MIFFPGIHQPGDARHFRVACVSLNRLDNRRKPLGCRRVLLDSGAFTKVNRFGGYPEAPEDHARRLYDLHCSGAVRILAAVAEDYMCEPVVTAKTGLTIPEHQRLTIERYDRLVAELTRLFGGPIPFHVMPVLQGQSARDYLGHLAMYGARLRSRMWVGVGSVCKRQGKVAVIEDLLEAIKGARPDLRLHGFWREADGAAEPQGSAAAVQRRQHGVVVQRAQAGPRRQRLARGAGILRTGHARAERRRAANAVRVGVRAAA